MAAFRTLFYGVLIVRYSYRQLRQGVLYACRSCTTKANMNLVQKVYLDLIQLIKIYWLNSK